MHRVTVHRTLAIGLAAAAGLALSACGSSGGNSNPLSGGATKGSVVVGSANFPEDELLAEIYAQDLQAHGIKVTTKFNIGAREVYYPQIKKGAITIIPEYNGALLTTSVDTTSTAATTAQVNAALRAKLPSTLAILNPSSAQDADSVTVTQAFAAKHHLKSIADLKPIAHTMTFGGPPECKTRADCIPGLKKHYGLVFKNFTPTDQSGPVTITDLKNGKVQAADLFTTTPQIVTDHFVSLADPKFNFAAQNVRPAGLQAGRRREDRGHPQCDLREADHPGAAGDGQGAGRCSHASYQQVAAGFLHRRA